MSSFSFIAASVRRFTTEQAAATATEYAFLLAAVIIVAVSAISAVAEGVKNAQTIVTEEISTSS